MAYITFQPKNHFNTILYTGTSSAPNAKTGVNFQPDLLWIKPRNFADPHRFHSPLLTASDYYLTTTGSPVPGETQNANCITSFDSDGFTLGNTDGGWNSSSYNYVAWNWLAGNGTSSNTDGSITSTVSANTASGFSLVKYTGTGSAATIGHGLGAVPKMIFTKVFSSSGNQWAVYHSSLGNGNAMFFEATTASTASSTLWNNTTPTSSVFSVGSAGDSNGSSLNILAYCFAETKGFSKFGSYTGNAASLFVYTGFRPAWLMVKRSDSADNWKIVDAKRSPFNIADYTLAADSSGTEGAPEGGINIDLLSNGFSYNAITNAAFNANGGTYIYAAFAEQPLVTSNGLPSNAR